ncbi:hypothetical protein [Clostridium ganghwense]|uniref:Replication terminator protein n=1 Tax=Clostridium ganghwense TaxID=312089 RepID=A0ABT4CU35_9CLOT|nr:hypothetical protein [Clostridium ganghwense]MCY6372585.1 hypothetical protein [Clostridium ganghwense]
MKYDKDKFIDILKTLKENLTNDVEFSEIRALETNPSTQVIGFKSKNNKKEGMIVVGENNNRIVVEVIVDEEKDKSKGTPVVEMKEFNIEAINELIEWLKKYCK